MFSLQKLLGKEDKFFDLLEAGAEEARASVQALANLIRNPDTVITLDEFVSSRRNEKRIAGEISEALCRTFVTALEREDIEALSSVLYKIPKTAEKIGERILLGPQHLQGFDLSRQVALLEKGSDAVVMMIRELRRGVHLEKIKSLNDRLQVIEGEADKLVLELLRTLYSSPSDPVKIIFLKDLLELVEKVIDRCRDAGNVIFNIVLKNS
jgi:uncharacterized protein